MSISLKNIQTRIRAEADPVIAEHSKRFFKSGPGEYAEGDQWLGIRVPVIRSIAKEFWEAELEVIFKLLESKYHEERLLALIMIVNRCKKGAPATHKQIYDHYLSHTHLVNNWDLVDTSAHSIVGTYLLKRSRQPLYQLAKSELLWDRRISMIATLIFIRKGETEDVLKLARIHLKDKHDLMHKAVGWMLRELGNRNRQAETEFLDQHYQKMPRTMLRYAIEKYPEKDRQAYLKGLR
jgi:3-methyladenine DNA glycosylase AlkD